MKRLLLCLLLATCPLTWAQEPIKIPAVNTSSTSAVLDGPTEASAGQRVDINVTGLPPVDFTKPLSESMAWLDAMQFKLDSPPADVGRLTGNLTFDIISREWRLTLSFVPRMNGTYVIVFVERAAPTIATHRVTVGGVAPVPFPPPVDPNQPVNPSKPTQITYVYEKDLSAVPRPVSLALQKLNAADSSVFATEFEEDTVSGNGQTPTQYVIALKAAQQAGLPALVVQAGTTVLRVVKAPTTEKEVLDAAK